MSTIVNGTQLVPALNGTLIDSHACTTAICSLQYAQMEYVPTFAGNVVYLVIFGLLLLAQIVLGSFYRTWGFLVGMFCGLILEIVGYIGRVLLHGDVFNFNYFVIYLVCLTIAPACLSASIYLCLSRLVIVYGKGIARLSPKTYTLTFICCDLVSLILQAAGGAIAAIADGGTPAQQSGINTMIAGLAFQVVSLTLFMVLSIDFIVAAVRASSHRLNPHFTDLRRSLRFRSFPWAIALATIFIFIRCCFRVAELKDGFGGSVANNETLFMIFEGPMIIVAVILLAVCHPGRCFGGSSGWREADWAWKSDHSKSTKIVNQEQEIKSAAV